MSLLLLSPISRTIRSVSVCPQVRGAVLTGLEGYAHSHARSRVCWSKASTGSCSDQRQNLWNYNLQVPYSCWDGIKVTMLLISAAVIRAQGSAMTPQRNLGQVTGLHEFVRPSFKWASWPIPWVSTSLGHSGLYVSWCICDSLMLWGWTAVGWPLFDDVLM